MAEHSLVWDQNVMQKAEVPFGLEISVLRLPKDAARWNLVYDFLKLRKEVFIEKMNWQLFDAQGIEFEQYDIATVATYVIVHDGPKVVAGARLLRCDTKIGGGVYSYMIRDAYYGTIDLPPEICDHDPPEDTATWELTRLVSNHSDPIIARTVLDCANDFIIANSGTKCLFLGPPGFLRMARSYGYDPVRMGKITGNDSGRFLAFSCDVIDRGESFI